jgi:hypothetical protein
MPYRRRTRNEIGNVMLQRQALAAELLQSYGASWRMLKGLIAEDCPRPTSTIAVASRPRRAGMAFDHYLNPKAYAEKRQQR